jgi:hypothetical protein
VQAQAVLDSIDRYGWGQGSWRHADASPLCVMGHVFYATPAGERGELIRELVDRVVATVPWNDAPGRTVDEVRAVFRDIRDAHAPCAVTDGAHDYPVAA